MTQGGRCNSKVEWTDMMTKVQALCQGQRVGQILKQSVDLLCSTKDSLTADIDECEGEGTLGIGTSGSCRDEKYKQ
jgi:hypothetical protein